MDWDWGSLSEEGPPRGLFLDVWIEDWKQSGDVGGTALGVFPGTALGVFPPPAF